MSAKWVALVLILSGTASALVGLKKCGRASFDDGSFLIAMAFLICGGAAALVGDILFAILFFASL